MADTLTQWHREQVARNMRPVIVIGFDADDAAIDGTILKNCRDDAHAIERGIRWAEYDAHGRVVRYAMYEFSDSWGPGRGIRPEDRGVGTTGGNNGTPTDWRPQQD